MLVANKKTLANYAGSQFQIAKGDPLPIGFTPVTPADFTEVAGAAMVSGAATGLVCFTFEIADLTVAKNTFWQGASAAPVGDPFTVPGPAFLWGVWVLLELAADLPLDDNIMLGVGPPGNPGNLAGVSLVGAPNNSYSRWQYTAMMSSGNVSNGYTLDQSQPLPEKWDYEVALQAWHNDAVLGAQPLSADAIINQGRVVLAYL